MEAIQREIQEYITENGRNLFKEWLSSLPNAKTRARIRERLDRVGLGNFGDSKFVGNGVFELRITFGPGYRVYFGQRGNTLIILLCGGDKDTQKADIERARLYWSDYRRRVCI